MKKIISVLSLLFVLASVNFTNAQVQSMTASSYTITDTATETLTLQVGSNLNTVSVQANFIKISGTVDGTAILQGSIDGTNYVTAVTVNTNSFTLTDVATQNYIWQVKPNYYKYYRVSTTGVGTMKCYQFGYLLGRNL